MFSVIRPILTARRLSLALILLLIVLFSTGCGLKGDLYLPDATAETQGMPEQEQETGNQDSDDDDAARS